MRMKSSARLFSTQVKLPCTLSCGRDAAQKVSGTAVRIEPGSMVLNLAGPAKNLSPQVGETVGLEVHLPVHFDLIGAKDLSIRGLIMSVKEMEDGARQFVITFRRAQFKDRNGLNGSGQAKRKGAAAAGELPM